MKRYDLHCHTQHSDGEDSVRDFVVKAKQVELSGFSITDHDTIDAYPDVFIQANQASLEVVSGVEISCLHHNEPVHILAYSFSIDDPDFKDFIAVCQEKRAVRNYEMVELFQKCGISIAVSDLEKKFGKKMHQIGRPHFAQWLIDHNIVASMQEAFQRYLRDGQKCYVLGHRPSVTEAIEKIHKANAFAILAHPHLMNHPKLVKDVLNLPLDGLECYYAKMGPHLERPWAKKAKEKNWIITGGSDYHGDSKLLNPLGCSWVNEQTFELLKNRMQENESIFKSPQQTS